MTSVLEIGTRSTHGSVVQFRTHFTTKTEVLFQDFRHYVKQPIYQWFLSNRW